MYVAHPAKETTVPEPLQGQGLLDWESTLGSIAPGRIGDILVSAGKLSQDQADRIAARQGSLRFGEAAIQRGLITPEDFQWAHARQYGYSCLEPGDDRISSEVVALHAPLSLQAEALRALRSELTLRWFGAQPARKRLAVIGVEAGAGRSCLAANLAVVLSQLGVRTLLVDADMRRPRQHQLFSANNRFGLSTVLARGERMLDARRLAAGLAVAAVPDLSLLTAGPLPPNPQELLGRRCFPAFLDDIDQYFDAIVLDTPAARDYADARTIAVRAQGALLVTRQDRTSLRDASRLCGALAELQVKVVGSVLGQF